MPHRRSILIESAYQLDDLRCSCSARSNFVIEVHNSNSNSNSELTATLVCEERAGPEQKNTSLLERWNRTLGFSSAGTRPRGGHGLWTDHGITLWTLEAGGSFKPHFPYTIPIRLITLNSVRKKTRRLCDGRAYGVCIK